MSNQETKVTLDINDWSYEDYMKFASLWAQNKTEEAMRYGMLIVAAWDYDIPLSLDQPELELPYLEMVALVKTINARIEAFTASVDTKGINIDLNRWKTKDFYAFQTALRELNFKSMERLLKQASSDYKEDDVLSFVDGVKLMKAVGDRQKELFRKG